MSQAKAVVRVSRIQTRGKSPSFLQQKSDIYSSYKSKNTRGVLGFWGFGV